MGDFVSRVMEAARGGWPSTLETLGIRTPKTKAPCPACGGKDRFRFDDNFKHKGDGVYICSQCVAGDGLNLVQSVMKTDALEAAKEVAGIIGYESQEEVSPQIQIDRKAAQEKRDDKEHQELKQQKCITANKAKSIIENTTMGESLYLKNKGLPAKGLISNDAIQGLKAPLLVVPFHRDNALATLQVINGDGEKRFLAGKGTQTDAYHIIDGDHSTVFIGEGYATTLTACKLMPSKGYVAGSSARIPSAIETARKQNPKAQLIILVDNNQAGMKALKKSQELDMDCIGILPPDKDTKNIKDWNDYFQKHGKKDTINKINSAIQEQVVFIVSNGSQSKNLDILPLCKKLQDTPTEQLLSKQGTSDLAAKLLNEKHSLIINGTGAVVVREAKSAKGEEETIFITSSAFKQWGANLRLPYLTQQDGSPARKYLSAVGAWEKSLDRRTYDGVVFYPDTLKENNYFNLWRGFSTKPNHVDGYPLCQKFLAHVLDNVCDGHQDYYKYIISWIADIFQNPTKKPGVAVILRSEGKGTGKSKVGEVISKLIGTHATKVSQSKHLLGNFNAHLASSLLVCVEESFWAGNHADAGVLKDFITGETMLREQKGVDVVELDSFHRLMMITNNHWAVPASHDERRYFVLNVADHQKQNIEYFKALTDDLENGGYEQLMSYLLDYDYSDIHIGSAPRTEGLEKQIEESLEPHQQFWKDCLYDGFIGLELLNEAVETDIAKNYVYDRYVEYLKSRGYRSMSLNKVHFGKSLNKMCASASAIKTTNGSHLPNSRVNGYRLPPLEECKAEFEKALSIPIEWDS